MTVTPVFAPGTHIEIRCGCRARVLDWDQVTLAELEALVRELAGTRDLLPGCKWDDPAIELVPVRWDDPEGHASPVGLLDDMDLRYSFGCGEES